MEEVAPLFLVVAGVCFRESWRKGVEEVVDSLPLAGLVKVLPKCVPRPVSADGSGAFMGSTR